MRLAVHRLFVILFFVVLCCQMMVFVADAMVDMGVPEAVVNSPAGMAFLERVGKPVYETLRVLCLNRARQRNSLELQMMVICFYFECFFFRLSCLASACSLTLCLMVGSFVCFRL